MATLPGTLDQDQSDNWIQGGGGEDGEVRSQKLTNEGFPIAGHSSKLTNLQTARELRSAAPIDSAEFDIREYKSAIITIDDDHDTAVVVNIFGRMESGGTLFELPTSPITTAGTGVTDLHARIITDAWAFLLVRVTAAGATGGTTGDIDIQAIRQT